MRLSSGRREAAPDGLYDLIANVRTIGNHWPLSVGAECDWSKPLRDNSWWTDGFGRMLVTDRTGRVLGYANYYRPSHSYQGLEIGYRVFRPEDCGKGFMMETTALFVGYSSAARGRMNPGACSSGQRWVASAAGALWVHVRRGPAPGALRSRHVQRSRRALDPA